MLRAGLIDENVSILHLHRRGTGEMLTTAITLTPEEAGELYGLLRDLLPEAQLRLAALRFGANEDVFPPGFQRNHHA